MREVLKDSTNLKSHKQPTKMKENSTDKEITTSFLTNMQIRTKDSSLKYDLGRCIELIEGKENLEFAELREEFMKVYNEKEELFEKYCDLKVENCYLKQKEL